MRAVLRWMAIGAALVLVVSAGLGLAAYRRFGGGLRTDSAAEQVLARYADQRPRVLAPEASNILVMGAAARPPKAPKSRPRPKASNPAAPKNAALGAQAAAVLLHLSADRGRGAALAVPGGLMVHAPACRRPGGGTDPAAYEPFGAAFRDGGAACAIRAFERLSGVRVDHHLLVDPAGFRKVAGASGAKGGGPGELLRVLVRETDRGALAHPARLYGLLKAATSSVTADPGLSSLPALYGLAGRLRALPAGRLALRTVPCSAAGGGREVPREPAADRLFAALRADRPLPEGTAGPGSVAAQAGSPEVHARVGRG